MSITPRSGKVVIRFRSKHVSFQQTLDPDKAAKMGLDLIDAAKKAAKKGKAFSEK